MTARRWFQVCSWWEPPACLSKLARPWIVPLELWTELLSWLAQLLEVQGHLACGQSIRDNNENEFLTYVSTDYYWLMCGPPRSWHVVIKHLFALWSWIIVTFCGNNIPIQAKIILALGAVEQGSCFRAYFRWFCEKELRERPLNKRLCFGHKHQL